MSKTCEQPGIPDSGRNTPRIAFAIRSLVLWAGATSAWAQCPIDWLPGEGVPGANGGVTVGTTWDPDGPGPHAELLVVGGGFSLAGNELASNIAAWDGAAWHALGPGIEGGRVYALTVYNGELIAAGEFTTAGGMNANNIARWNGTTWQPLGPGIFDGDVWALAVYNGELIAGGLFTTAGGVSANHVARWNGSAAVGRLVGCWEWLKRSFPALPKPVPSSPQ